MNIHELDSYNLGDAVKFNDRLNPRIWGADEKMRPEVREQLLKIADDFREFLGIDVEVKDITVSGSNAAYTYTPHSDIDLHLVVDLPKADASEVYRELFDAKKYAYNEQHDIKIGGYDVELYVQDANQTHHSQGIYSIVNDDWISVPKRRKPDVDDISVKSKFEDLGHRIEAAIESGSYERMTDMAKRLKDYRQAGLDAHGEFGPENLAFKILRTQGLIKRLYDARAEAKDQLLSLDERKRKKKKKSVRYGYGGYWYPGTAYAGQDHPAGTEGGGGDGGGGESIKEDISTSDEQILKDFVDFCVKELKIKQVPVVKLRKDPQWPTVHKTFGRYINDKQMLEVAWGNRHVMDVLRTVAHELTHCRQHERETVPASAGETGSEYENEANARAGVLMRDWARLHPEHFDAGQVKELEESASGYIPTKAQAKDPRFSMALTQDIKPGQVGKEANKLKLRTDKQGQPQIARANGLFENLYKEYKKYKADEDYSPDEPPGPEFKPTMPAGTLRVDVSDVYDWYKLGQHISNLDGLGQHDFGQGPPSSIISFGDEDTEHKFIDQIEATGLDVTDIDPADLKKRPGKKIKTDPTYNVNEGEQLDEVRMSPGALSKFADSEEAQGIRAGFEAELIFRDTSGDADDDYEMEADMDADERARSIEQVIEFFSNDDWGYGIGERQANRLRDQLDEAYFEWRDDQIITAFDRESEDLVREVWLEERPMNERILSALVDGIGMDDAEADKILAIGDKAPRFTKSSEQTAYKEANPGYDKYLEAVDIADEILDEEVEASIDRQDGYYDQALDNFRDGYDEDDSSFFSDIGLRWMSDVMNEYGLDWPYMTGGGSSNYGSRDWDEIGESLRNATGMPVKVSTGYHSQKRGDYYVIEPDGSLDPDDKNEEVGLEIVSPPMPLNQAIEQLQKVIEWANDPDQGNAYTNRSTGLHMGVSIPYKGGDVDYLKLILFMGDKYVLDKFGRAANTYTASAMEKLRQNVAGSRNRGDDKIASALELMKGNLLELAQRYVQQGVGNSKYTSAHIKDGYIEFRSPGGDYLAKADEEINVLDDTMRRFAYAMYLAGRPDLERPEYYKKLYKLIAPEGNKDLELFSKFSAGEITADQLKKQWAEKVISKEVPSTDKKSNWRLYKRYTGEPVTGLEFSNYTELDALERAKARVSPASSMTDFNLTYELRDVGTNTGRWRVIRRDNHETLEIIDAVTRGEASDQAYEKYTDVIPYYIEPYSGTEEPKEEPKLSRRAKLATQIAQPKDYVIVNKHSLLPFYTFRASTMSQAVDFAVTYLQDKNLDVGNFTVQRASNVKQAVDNAVDSRRMQQRLDPLVRDIDITIDQDSDQYEIVDRRNNRVVLQYRADDAADAGDKFNNWLRNQGMPEDTENYGYRPLVAVNESIDDAQRARVAMDAAAKKLGYANWSAVPQSAKNTVMQMAVNALKLDNGHYNMLDRKNKQ